MRAGRTRVDIRIWSKLLRIGLIAYLYERIDTLIIQHFNFRDI